MSDLCEICDRPCGTAAGECDRARVEALYGYEADDSDDARDAAMAARAECTEHRVDWRASTIELRALCSPTFERDARAEIARLRALLVDAGTNPHSTPLEREAAYQAEHGHTRCYRIEPIVVAGVYTYQYKCRDCGLVFTVLEARALCEHGPMDCG